MLRLCAAASVFAATFVACLIVQDQDSAKQEKKQDDKIVIPGDGENAIARRDFMRTKLMYSQNIFEGLTTGDFELINAGIMEVNGITEAEKWIEIDNDDYRKLTEDFKTSVKRLQAAAESENIEATALRYYQMSTSCIDCHAHIRISGYQF